MPEPGPAGRPLDGVLVVSIENAVSAPFATRQLGDLGARILKIERLDGGDFARQFDSAAGGLGAHFAWVNRNKESIALDLKSVAGRQIVLELIGRADVFVHNMAPGASAKLALDPAALRAGSPRLIVCSISGYGTGGPYEGRTAYDLIVQSEAAVVTMTGSPERPIKPGIAVADIAAGGFAYSSVLAALLNRHRTGAGAVIEVSMLDAVAEWMGYAMMVAGHGGEVQTGLRMSHPSICPYNGYATADGDQIVLSVQNDREWRRLAAQVLARPDLAHDEGWATNIARVSRRDEVDRLVGARIGELDSDQAISALLEAGIACGRVRTPAELVEHPQLVERGRWQRVASPVGPVRTFLPPAVSTAWDTRLDPIPALGEHTEAVLRELGRDDAEIARLREAGVVGSGG